MRRLLSSWRRVAVSSPYLADSLIEVARKLKGGDSQAGVRHSG